MSFKRKLFRSNIKVAIIPIVVFMLLMIAFLGLYRSNIMLDVTKNGVTDADTIHLTGYIKDTNYSVLDSKEKTAIWAKEFDNYDYGVVVAKDSKIIFEGGEHIDEDRYESMFKEGADVINNIPITSVNHNKIMINYRFENDGSTYVIIARSNNHHFSGTKADETQIFIGLVAFFILITICIIILCRRYSKRLIKQLSAPIDLLGEAAKRIESGNLDDKTIYESDDEFKPVFDSFNDMQDRLKETILHSLEREHKQQEMVAEISHDIKTPLTAIRGYIKGIQDGIANTPEKQSHYFNRISEKTDEMVSMIEEILIYSKLEREKVVFHEEEVEIVPYLSELTKAISEDYTEKAIDISVDETSENARVSIDTLQFNRVISNIIGNSYKYSCKDNVSVKLNSVVKNNMVEIRITDNGPGVPEEKLALIFDTFYRTDESRNNPVKGSGLGLSICKHIITNLGGTISAYNKNGLCIKIKLPVK